jgi:hypothetical protein
MFRSIKFIEAKERETFFDMTIGTFITGTL